MKIINIRKNSKGNTLIDYTLNNVDRAYFKQLAKKEHQKYNEDFINKKFIGLLKRALKTI